MKWYIKPKEITALYSWRWDTTIIWKWECTFLDLSSSKHFGFCTLQISCGIPHACFVCIIVATALYFLQVLQHSDRYYALPYALLSFVTLSSSLKGCPAFAHGTSFETQIHMRNLGGQWIKLFSFMHFITLVSKILNGRKVTLLRNSLLRCFYCSNS